MAIRVRRANRKSGQTMYGRQWGLVLYSFLFFFSCVEDSVMWICCVWVRAEFVSIYFLGGFGLSLIIIIEFCAVLIHVFDPC